MVKRTLTQTLNAFKLPRRITMLGTLFFAVLMTLSCSSWAKTLSVETERQTVEFGDIINLYVTADFQSTASQLNLDKLKDQFEVLGSQRSNNIQIVNGDFQSSTRWLIQLLPKQVGELMIPPFNLGNVSSESYKITVLPLQKSLQSGDLKPYFLEATVTEPEPYVQAQVIYTLRFLYQGRYISGNIRPPEFGDAQVELLKDGAVFNKQLQGKSYTVHEWVYALYPQSSGQLSISSPAFNGRIQLSGRLKQVTEKAESVTLNVLPEAESFKQQAHNAWLPAQKVTLSQEWNLPQQTVHVGDSLTQTVTLSVDGLMANQLPDLDLPAQADFKVYADQPVSQQNKLQNGIQSIKQFKRAIIPTTAGTLTIPQQTLYWWDTQSNRLQSSVIEGKTLKVLPATQSPSSEQADQAPLQAHDLKAVTPSIMPNTGQGTPSSLWMFLSGFLAVLWLFTSVLWYRAQRQLKTLKLQNTRQVDTTQPQNEQAWSDLENLCALPAGQLYPGILAWLKQAHQIEHLADLPDGDLKNGIQQLEASLFHEGEFTDTQRQTLCAQLKSFSHTDRPAENVSKLQNLYPA
ncbi:BatD family protein [Thiomicrorhabdus chilensis]|uniref:BatD family protein n=1 Tax=Thiomicrorhabdus chilensis TaxID=63656 RepID=UPI000425F926|nr:BatD family protein [Thiomicrorhabdus chilensis]